MTSIAAKECAPEARRGARGRLDARRTAVACIAAAVLVGVSIWATRSIWAGIFKYALENEEQSHSLLAVPVAAWLVWVRRSRFAGMTATWSVAGPLAMAAGWALAVAGFRSGIDLGMHLGALLVVIGAAFTAFGPDVFLRFLPAVGALFLVLPVPGRFRSTIAGPLQEWSAQIAHFALDLVGVPVVRSGNVLTVASVPVTIAEACNGMRMVSALAVITYAFVFSFRLRPSARLGLLAISPAIALAVNVLRLVPTALCYGYASRATAEAFHDISGWVVLMLALAILLGVVRLLRWLEVPIDQTKSARTTFEPFVLETGSRLGWAAPLASPVVLLGMLWMNGFDARTPRGHEAYLAAVRQEVNSIPYSIGGAVGSDQEVSPGTERLLRPNAILQRRYTDPLTASGFGLTVVHCSDARDLLDHYPPVCYPAHGWKLLKTQDAAFKAGGAPVPVRVYDFSLRTELGETSTRVVSFFVLPGESPGLGRAANSMDEVERASRSPSATGLGAAHIMVSFAGDASDRQIADTMGPVLETLEATVRTTGGGIGGK